MHPAVFETNSSAMQAADILHAPLTHIPLAEAAFLLRVVLSKLSRPLQYTSVLESNKEEQWQPNTLVGGEGGEVVLSSLI